MEFLRMGGYAVFVWPAFAITAVVMIANLIAARRREAEALIVLRRRRDAGSVQP
jgi:heme exporter protein CcmD